tara:strand:- start:103 stop:258 length:156 start_codon:yes stop_codon:yes gene_type:complete
MISIIGIPSDKNYSFLRGCSKAPPLIMKEFFSEYNGHIALKILKELMSKMI